MNGVPSTVVSIRIMVTAVFRCAGAALLIFAAVHAAFGLPEYSDARRMAAARVAPVPKIVDHFRASLECAALAGAFLALPVLVRRLVPCPPAGCPGCGYAVSSDAARCPECGLVLSGPGVP